MTSNSCWSMRNLGKLLVSMLRLQLDSTRTFNWNKGSQLWFSISISSLLLSAHLQNSKIAPHRKWQYTTLHLTAWCNAIYGFITRKLHKPHRTHPLYILIYLFIFNIKYIINSLITLVFNPQKKKFDNLSKCLLEKPAQNKEKLAK